MVRGLVMVMTPSPSQVVHMFIAIPTIGLIGIVFQEFKAITVMTPLPLVPIKITDTFMVAMMMTSLMPQKPIM